MKKLVTLALASLFALSAAACAPKPVTEEMRVKCPACGYEFTIPAPHAEP
jgi:hypothetical protein